LLDSTFKDKETGIPDRGMDGKTCFDFVLFSIEILTEALSSIPHNVKITVMNKFWELGLHFTPGSTSFLY